MNLERVNAAETRLARAQAETTAALAELTAAIFDKPSPATPHQERFVTSLQAGDHVQWENGWWMVDSVDVASDRADAVLVLKRVGRVPVELLLAGNVTLVSVREECAA